MSITKNSLKDNQIYCDDPTSLVVLRDTLAFDKIHFLCGGNYIWRGYSCAAELLPSASRLRKSGFSLSEELQYVHELFLTENKLGHYPFPMPRIFERGMIDQAHPEMIERIKNYPTSDKDLLQVLSFIQHKYGGTSLIDFSDNFLKALFFAIGKKENWEKSDSHILGIDTLYFSDARSRHKKPYPFDIYWPSYYMNTRIQHQEGLFLYQIFDTLQGDVQQYLNIIDFLNEDERTFGWKEVKIQEIIDGDKNGGHNHVVAYYDIIVPVNEKHRFSNYLKEIGITSEYLFCTADERKIDYDTSECLPVPTLDDYIGKTKE